jgi:hypothetical protein
MTRDRSARPSLSLENWLPEVLTFLFLATLVGVFVLRAVLGGNGDKPADFLLPINKIQPRTAFLPKNTPVILMLVNSPDVSAHISAELLDDLPLSLDASTRVRVELSCGVDCSSLEDFARQLSSASAIYIVPYTIPASPSSTVPPASPTSAVTQP